MFRKIKSTQLVIVALQHETSPIHSIFNFLLSRFGCPFALDTRDRRPVRPPPLHATAYTTWG